MKRHNFKKLHIWQDSMELVNLNYQFTLRFPSFEKFGMVNQMNRSSVSIPSNIAEGTSKRTSKHFTRFQEDSLGSAYEWETQLIICHNLGYMTSEGFQDAEKRIKKLQGKISNFIDKISLNPS